MAGDQNEKSNAPALPEDESRRHSNEHSKPGFKEGPADKELNSAGGNESSAEGEHPDVVCKNIMEYAWHRMGQSFRGVIDKLFDESSNGSINHLKMLFGMLGIREQEKQIAGPPEARPGFFSQLLHNEVAKRDPDAPRHQGGDLNPAATTEAESDPFPGEGEAPPQSS